jgi:hypothetical protein
MNEALEERTAMAEDAAHEAAGQVREREGQSERCQREREREREREGEGERGPVVPPTRLPKQTMPTPQAAEATRAMDEYVAVGAPLGDVQLQPKSSISAAGMRK